MDHLYRWLTYSIDTIPTKYLMLGCSIWVAMGELAQGAGFLPGVCDLKDIGAGIAGAVVSGLLASRESKD